MISIIVCSKSPEISVSYSENINNTIGNVEYELIWIDNALNNYNIFEAYNKGVKIAKGDYLCFAHEDIVYHSMRWGEIVSQEFAHDATIGMCGLVGGHILTSISTCWWSTDKCRGSLRQGIEKDGKYQTFLARWTSADDNDRFVVSVDGVWMTIRKELFDRISFDSETYSGFHFYDMDISMQILSLGYKILIVDGIEVEHKSVGNVSASFYKNCIAFHRKWDYLLPVFSSNFTTQANKEYYVPKYKKLLYDRVYFPLSASFFYQTRFVVRSIVLIKEKMTNMCQELFGIRRK